MLLMALCIGNNVQAAVSDSTYHKGHHRGHDGKRGGHHRGIKLFHRHYSHHHGKDHARSGEHSHRGRGDHGNKGANNKR